MIKLTPTASQHTYSVGDGSGYRYTIYVSKEDEFGSWSSSVTITDWGATTPEAAVEHLVPALEHLIRQIKEKQE